MVIRCLHVQASLLLLLISVVPVVLPAQMSAELERRLKLRDAADKPDGLHQAAKLNGGTFRRAQPSHRFVHFSTLESLAENSDLAIIGTPLSSEEKLISEGRHIVTEYKMKVLEPIQGKVQWDEAVTVDLPGGKVAFADGTTAEEEIGDLPRLQIGHRYVIYLESVKELYGLMPLGGPEGVFELNTDGKVSPLATPEFTQAAAKGDDSLEFVEKVRDAARFQKRQ